MVVEIKEPKNLQISHQLGTRILNYNLRSQTPDTPPLTYS